MTDTLQPRKIALSVLEAVRRGGDTDVALEGALAKGALERRDRAFVTLLVMTALRQRAVAEALLGQFLKQPLDAKKAAYVQDVLLLGAVQLLWLEVPAHAVVHSAVELVKHSRFAGFAKLVNAVLQSVLREGKHRLATLDEARLSTPDWLWEQWMRDYGEDTARAIAAANRQEPALDITAAENPALWAGKLDGKLLSTGSIRLANPGMVTELPGFAEGAWWVQDVAAALPARLFGDLTGKQALDLCAAPGGKTLQLAAMGAEVTAVDRSGNRLKRMRENLSRLAGLQNKVKLVTADVLRWEPETRFDAILLDAPCSATGTLRRHPEIAWRKSKADVEELAGLQRKMLLRALNWLKPGGVLVYCVCSLEKAEGEAHILEATQSGACVQPVMPGEVGGLKEIVTREGYVRCFPHHLADEGGMDGFFAVRFSNQS